MRAKLLGMYRLDPNRPLPDRRDLPSVPLDSGASILKEDEDLLLLSPHRTGIKVAERNGVIAAAWGAITGSLSPLPDGLRADDPRALLHLYAEHGEKFARQLNGHFALLLLDRPRGLFMLVQDRFPGIATAYWLERDGRLLFSDRIEPLVRIHPEERRRIDRQALHHFMADTYLTAPHTIYEGVRQVPSGEMLRVEGGAVARIAYDGWHRPARRESDGKAALAHYRGLLEDALGDWLARDPSCGFLLSGGLDSSVNVALAAKRNTRALPTFGIAATDFHTDAPYARRVASLCGATYTEKLIDGSEVDDLPKLVWELENPFYEPGVMLSWNALRLASEHVGSVIGGETADQLFGACVEPCWRRHGVRRRFGPLLKPWLSLVRGAARLPKARASSFVRKVEHRLIGHLDPAYWCARYGFRTCDLPALMRRPLPEDDRYDMPDLPDGDLDALWNYGCTVLNRDYSCYGILLANGRLGDLLGLETFSPFCDRRVADYILSLDTELRYAAVPGRPGEFVFKALHRRLARELLEPDIVDRPKQGGAINPLIHLQDERRLGWVGRALLGSPFLSDLCRRETIAALFDDVPHNATRIMQLVALDLWHHLFIETSSDAAPDFTLTEFLKERAG